MCCKSTETGPPQRRQQVKVVELIYKCFRLYVCVFICEICIQYERLYAHKINCASATLRKHERNKKHIHFEISNTVAVGCCCCCCCTGKQFQVHGNWSRFGANLWTRRWLSSIPHKMKLLAAVSFV